MSRDSHTAGGGWPICLAGGLLFALVFIAVWAPCHSPRPLLPTSDLYTHLSVARHLARGEGFLTDVTYPLSFAFPFARELPQPLLHRPPGFALLLTAPYLAGGGDPERTVEMVRIMQIILLGLVVGAGTVMFLRRGRAAAVGPWLLLLFFSPLLVFAVDWGLVELSCSLALLLIWLRTRGTENHRPDWRDGLLAGVLAMLRPDLFWVPFFWWVLGTRPRARLRPGRRMGLVLAAWLVVTVPWAVRNIQVTGRPLFSLQAYAEHVKDTSSWPGYSVYRQLEPRPWSATLAEDPEPVLRKFGRGVRFYFRELPRLVPRPGIWSLGIILAGLAFRRGREEGWRDSGPAALAAATTLLLVFQYAFFDHSLRHLLVVAPVLFWELSLWTGTVLPDLAARRGRLPSGPARPILAIGLAAAAVAVVLLLFPCRVPGWESAARQAADLAAGTARDIVRARDAGPGVLFVDSSAVPWFVDRPVVWSPATPAIRAEICRLLEMPDAGIEETP